MNIGEMQNKINNILIDRERDYGLIENDNDQANSYKKEEYKLWYEGNTADLSYFYKSLPKETFLTRDRPNYYATVNKGNSLTKTLYHFNIPELISNTMAHLLFGKPVTITVELDGQKKLEKQLQSLLEDIEYENDMDSLLQEAAILESYSGAVGFKINLDKDFSDYPIITLYPKERLEVRKKYDRITEVIFLDYYYKNNKRYTLKSIYGKGYILFKLFNDKNEEVNLTDIPETSNLKDIKFKDSSGHRYNRLLAVYKENKKGGKSDYSGLIDTFCAIDEIYTQKMDLVEKSSIRTYVDEAYCPKDSVTRNTILPSNLNDNTTVIKKSQELKNDPSKSSLTKPIEREYLDVSNTVKCYEDSIKTMSESALRLAGISPVSTGLLEDTGANASAEAILARDAASMKTRAAKIALWNNSLQDLAELLIGFSSIKAVGDTYFIEDYNNTIKVEFPTYHEAEERLTYANSLKTLVDNGLISQEYAIDDFNKEYLHLDEDDLELMKQEIEAGGMNSLDDELNKEDTDENDAPEDIGAKEDTKESEVDN